MLNPRRFARQIESCYMYKSTIQGSDKLWLTHNLTVRRAVKRSLTSSIDLTGLIAFKRNTSGERDFDEECRRADDTYQVAIE